MTDTDLRIICLRLAYDVIYNEIRYSIIQHESDLGEPMVNLAQKFYDWVKK